MSTYLETVKRSFVDVPTQPGVDTVAFWEATGGLIKMFDLLGNSAFVVVQNDMNGNVKKIRTRYEAFPEQSKTLEDLVKHESTEKKRTATEGLLWLLRGLKFTQIALSRSQANKAEELNVSFDAAYAGTLKPHHSFVVKPIFALAMKACPYRKDFYAKLGPAESDVDGLLQAWLNALEKIIAQLEAFYAAGN
ncbi:BQ2448_2445 [Microbotryum intermedium]|uniref:BQ2448_2445 protein n=1 Tax=Microbotryum intermedium TaxID=269621 RepID=A0A238F898_9BASI|nr:BQ2448_2445 [Microbotryum intermedium]